MILMCTVFKNKINELDLPNFEYGSIIHKIFRLYWANEDKRSALKMTNFVQAHNVCPLPARLALVLHRGAH